MFGLLDAVILLAAGRRILFGPTASLPALLDRHYGLPVPPGKPPAEHMLEVGLSYFKGVEVLICCFEHYLQLL